MQKLIVKNFRQISTAEIEIKKLLLLIGEQASGKSTLAKLIYFFKSLKEDYFNLIYENAQKTPSDLEKKFIEIIQEKFKIYFGYASELADKFEITFFYHFDENSSHKNRYLKLSKDNSLKVEFENTYFEEIVQNTRNIAQEIVNFTSRQTDVNETNYLIFERAKNLFINGLVENVNRLFYDYYSPQFFPAGRNITVSFPEQFQASFLARLVSVNQLPKSVDSVLMKSFILHSKFLTDYFKGKDFSKEIENDKQNNISQYALDFLVKHSEYILQGKYSNADGNEKILYNGNGLKSIPLNIASSGQQESVRIIQDLWYLLMEKIKSFRIIEEPEAHLYPQAQKKLVELMALVINKTESQIIITTHSPYILSILNNLLMYSEVIENQPNAVKEIKAHFGTQDLKEEASEKINLTSKQVQAYSLCVNKEIYCASIIDRETGLVGDNFLDNITEELNQDFNTLHHLNFQNH